MANEPRLTEEMERTVAEAMATEMTPDRGFDVFDEHAPGDMDDELNYVVRTADASSTVDYDVARFTLGYDADFYILARRALPAYVAEVARLRGVLARVVEALELACGAEGISESTGSPADVAACIPTMAAALAAAREALGQGGDR